LTTDRPTSTPRKRSPRASAVPVQPAADPQPPRSAPSKQSPRAQTSPDDDLRHMLIQQGYDPDVVLGQPQDDPAEDDAHARVVEGEVIDEGHDSSSPEEKLQDTTVKFHGRTIRVRAPEPEQIMVIKRMQTLFSNAAKSEKLTADEAIRLMDRALKAVCSVIVDPDDVVFLEDLLLTRQAKLDDTLPLMKESMEALKRANSTDDNRADRRSAGKKGRARLAMDDR